MPKLFLVGITPDHRALVLSEHARAKRGDMVLEIDDRLLEAIDKAQRLRTFDEGNRLESAALPTRHEFVNGDDTTVPRLTPREIQQRLRAGESIAAMARSSGTDEAWIRRFATPVLAEQAKVVERARSLTFTKRGVGPSGATLGPAVAANVIDRGVPLTLADLEAGWGAYQRPEGEWSVTFTFPQRGRRQTAEWHLDVVSGDLTARNKLASELAWRESGKKLPQPAPAKVAPAPKKVAAGRVAPAAPVEGATQVESPPKESAPKESAPKESAPEESPATGSGEVAATTDAGRPRAEETTQLPLEDAGNGSLPVGGLVRKAPPPARKAPAKKAPEAKAPDGNPALPAKRTAAAMTDAPAQRVVPVSPPGSMPPTDLDVVDVLGDRPFAHDDVDDEPVKVIVLPPSPEDEAAAPKAPTGQPEPVDHDPPTGPISLRAGRPQPAPLGAPPAPPGGPPAP